MAAAAHVTAGVYGTIAGQPPYTNPTEPWANFNKWKYPAQMSFPTTGTVFHEVNPGQRVGNTSNYIYSIIEVQPTGLTGPNESSKYASNVLLATLATNAG